MGRGFPSRDYDKDYELTPSAKIVFIRAVLMNIEALRSQGFGAILFLYARRICVP